VRQLPIIRSKRPGRQQLCSFVFRGGFPVRILAEFHHPLTSCTLPSSRRDETTVQQTSLTETCSVCLVFRCTTVSSKPCPIRTKVVTFVTSLACWLVCERAVTDADGTNPLTHSLTTILTALGYQWASSLLGFVALAMAPFRTSFPFPLSCIHSIKNY
jgi:hypothetical protein